MTDVVNGAPGEYYIVDIYGEALDAARFVAKYNVNMERIPNTLATYGPGSLTEEETAALLSVMREDMDNGFTVWESLSRRHSKLANGIHDMVYYIIAPLSQIVIKNIIRERLSKDLLGL